MTSLLHILRWEASDPTADASAGRRTMARTYALLFGTGGTLVLVTLPLSSGSERFVAGMVVPALLAYAVVAVVLFATRRVPSWGWSLIPAGGSVLVSGVVASSPPAQSPGYAMLYFWVVVSAFYFFGRLWAFVNLAFVGASFATVLALRAEVPEGALLAVMAGGALTITGTLITALRQRIDVLVRHLRATADRQRALAALGEQALESEHPDVLLQTAADLVLDLLEASRAEVALRIGDDLVLRAVAGDARGRVRGMQAGASSPVGRAADDGDGRLSPHDGGTALALPIRGPGGTLGALAAVFDSARDVSAEERNFVATVTTILADALDRHAAQLALAHQARYDQLTGLPNRVLFAERVDAALERTRTTGRSVAILFVDVDGFKAINDGFGHAAGDELLRGLAPALRVPLYVTDTLARFGGDEYVVLCEDISDPVEAVGIAEGIRVSATRPVPVGGSEHRGTVSIGVVLGRGGETTFDELLRDADTAMYRAKELGGDQSVLFDDALRRHTLDGLQLEHALRGALERAQLRLLYQPVVSLADGEFVGVEALMRWEHPELGAVSPADFIPLAERTGQIVSIGRWALEEACRQLAVWQHSEDRRAALTMNVNVSARQLADPAFPEVVADVLAATGVSPSGLALELTETALFADHGAVASTLDRLGELGVGVVLDDFGTGYSSLSYLDRFRFDTIKVDRSFVGRLGTDGRSEAIVGAVGAIAEQFGMRVIAEGVETALQAETVAGLGCRYAQGFHFARPMPAEHLTALLRGDPLATVTAA